MEQTPGNYDSPPGLYRGLRLAESTQLALDYSASPEAFEMVNQFCGKYVDERDLLAKQLFKHQELIEGVNKNQTAYFEIFDTVGLRRSVNIFRERNIRAEPEAVINIAHGAAGAYMLDLKHEAADSLNDFLLVADDFSVLLAEFCQERLESDDLIIMGQKFDYKLGFLACRDREYPTSNVFINMVYGSQKRFIDLRKALVVNRTSKEMENVKYGHAGAQEWMSLLGNLELITRF